MPKKKTTLLRSPDFKTIYAVGAIGNWTPYDFRINFYSEKVMEDEEEAYVNNTQVILSPQATKEFALWLMQNVKDYEATYGKSKMPNNSVSEVEDDSKFKSELRSEMKNDIKSELKDDIQRFISLNIKSKLKKDLGDEIKTDLRKYFKQNLHNDLKKDLKVIPTPELKKDIKKDLKAVLKQDLRRDIKRDLRREFQRNLPTGTTPASKLKTKSKPHMDEGKHHTSDKLGTKTSKLKGKKK